MRAVRCRASAGSPEAEPVTAQGPILPRMTVTAKTRRTVARSGAIVALAHDDHLRLGRSPLALGTGRAR